MQNGHTVDITLFSFLSLFLIASIYIVYVLLNSFSDQADLSVSNAKHFNLWGTHTITVDFDMRTGAQVLAVAVGLLEPWGRWLQSQPCTVNLKIWGKKKRRDVI